MITTQDLLIALFRKGVAVWQEEDGIHVLGRITSDEQQTLKEIKPEILTLLRHWDGFVESVLAGCDFGVIEDYDERSCIREYDGGLTRARASAEALADVLEDRGDGDE